MAISGAELQFLISMRDQASAIIAQVGNAMGGMGQQAKGAQNDVRGLAGTFTELNQALEVVKKGAEGFKRTFGEALDTFSAYDKGMTVVRRVTDMTREQMGEFTQQFDAMTNRLRAIPVQRLNEIAGQAAQLGIQGTPNILKFTEVVAKLETSLNDLGQDAPKLIVRVLNATGEGVAGVERFGNVLVRMGKDAASSNERILNMTALLAQATAQFKMGSASMLGMATAAADLNFQPELFGTAVSRSLTQLYEATLNNTQGMRTLSQMTGLTAEQFRDLIKTDPSMALITFTEAMNDVDKSGRSLLSFLTMFNLQADENRRVLGSMAEKSGEFREKLASARLEAQRMTALGQEFGATLEAYYTATTNASNAWALFKKNLGGALAPAATVALNALSATLTGLSSAFGALPAFGQQIAAWGAVVVAAVGPAILVIRALGAAFALLGLGSVMGALGSMAGFLVSIAGAALRVVVAVAGFARIGQLIALAGSAIAGLVAAVGAVPLAIGVAIAAAVVALGAFVAYLYTHWEEVKAFFSQSWGEIGQQIVDALVRAFTTAMAQAKKLWTEFWGWFWNTGSGSDADLTKQLDTVYRARFELQDKIKQLESSSAPASEVQAAKDRLESLTQEALRLRDIIDRRAGYTGPRPGEADPSATAPRTPAPGVSLTPRINSDVSVLSRLSDVNRKSIEELDNFSKAMEKIRQQTVALDQLRSLPKDDQYYKNLGIDPSQVDAYIARLQGLMALERIRADATLGKLKSLQEETQAAGALTATEKQALEIEQAIRQVREAKGALTAAETAALREQVTILQQTRTTTALRDATREMDKQILTARQLTREQQNQAEILLKILDFEKEHGKLTEAQRTALAGQVSALQQIQQFNQVRDSVDTIGAANRKFTDDINTLNRALKEGTVSLEYYNYLVKQLRTQTLDARDPWGAQVKSMREAIQLQSISGDYQDADRQTQTTINQLRDRGVQITREQNQALSDYNRAMQDVKKSQESGLEGWARQVGSMRDNVLDLQKSLMTSFSSQLVDTIYGANKTWSDFLLGASKQITTMFVNQGLKELVSGLGNNLGGLLSGFSSKDALAKAASSANALGGMANTQVMNVNAATVNIGAAGSLGGVGVNGAGQLVVGNGSTGALASGSAALAGIPTGTSVDQSAALLRQFEGYRSKPYWDVNAWRVGYGSDTITDPTTGAVRRVQQGDEITRAMADADLARRIPEFQGTIRGQIGDQAWGGLNPQTQAALTSVGYNYGSLPSGVVSAVGTGDQAQIAASIRALQGHNGGINADRRNQEADYMMRGGGSDVSQSTREAADAQRQLSEAQRLTGQSAETAGSSVQGAGTALQGTGTAATNAGTSVQTAGTAIQGMGTASDMAGVSATTAGASVTGLGTAAGTVGAGADQAATATTNLGTAASTAAPQIEQAGQALQKAGTAASTAGAAAGGAGVGAGGAAGAASGTDWGKLFGVLGGGTGIGTVGTSLITAGIGLGAAWLAQKLRGDPKEVTRITYVTPREAVSRLHGGGLVGFEGVGNMIDTASAYTRAPRLHTGLQSDEFRAVLQRSERVLTANDNRRVEGMLGKVANGAMPVDGRGGTGTTVNMYVQAQDANSFKRSQNSILAKTQAGMSRAAMRSR